MRVGSLTLVTQTADHPEGSTLIGGPGMAAQSTTLLKLQQGDPFVLSARATQRFWSKVRKTDGCWLWTAGTSRASGCGIYGKFSVGYTTWQAHRIAWMLTNGYMPPITLIRHTCDNSLCVRPDHLLPGSVADNARDRVERGRAPRGDANGKTKLSSAQLRALRETIAAGDKTQVELAVEYGLTVSYVSKIVNGHVRHDV
jgi:hypothetical protein